MRRESSGSVRIFYPKLNREDFIQELKRKIENLQAKFPVSSVVLFGSYASGNYTVASDVDILVVYKGKERKNAFATVKKTLDIPLLEPHVYSEAEYEKRRETLHRMIKDGITLFP